MSKVPETRMDAYEKVKRSGEDVSLRLKVAAALGKEPMTTSEMGAEFPEHSANAIRPRVNELVRMGCVEREGKRKNPSGHDAYIHHLTDKGILYVRGKIDPDPGPTLSELKSEVVRVSRAVVSGEADKDVLQLAVHRYDKAKSRMDPEGNDE